MRSIASPGQSATSGPRSMFGAGFTFTVTVSLTLQVPGVTSTQYVAEEPTTMAFVCSPVLHTYVAPGSVTSSVTVCPAHRSTSGPSSIAEGVVYTTVTSSTAVHPAALVTVTENVPSWVTSIVAV